MTSISTTSYSRHHVWKYCDGPSLFCLLGFAVLTSCRRLVGGVGEVGGAGRVVNADGAHLLKLSCLKATVSPFSKRFLSPCIPLVILLWFWQLRPNFLTFMPHLIIVVSVYFISGINSFSYSFTQCGVSHCYNLEPCCNNNNFVNMTWPSNVPQLS